MALNDYQIAFDVGEDYAGNFVWNAAGGPVNTTGFTFAFTATTALGTAPSTYLQSNLILIGNAAQVGAYPSGVPVRPWEQMPERPFSPAVQTIACTGGTVYLPGAPQAPPQVLEVTGTLASNGIVSIPFQSGSAWIVNNLCTLAGHTLTITPSGGTGAVAGAGVTRWYQNATGVLTAA
jgi:hypothetical protein